MMKFLSEIKYYASVGSCFIKMGIQAQLEYPAVWIGWLVSNALQFLASLGMLRLLMFNFPHINGWSFEQIAFMFGLGIMSHAFSMVLLANQMYQLQYHVTEGGFDRMLLRPLPVYLHYSMSYLNLNGFTDLIPGIIIFVYGANAVDFHFSAGNIGRVLLVVTGATMIRCAIYTIAAVTAFWVKRSGVLVSLQMTLMNEIIRYPAIIFGRVLQGIFTFALPIAFIAFYPASQWLGLDTGFHIPGEAGLWTMGIGVFMTLLAFGFFNLGLRRYDSAGS